MSAIAHLRTRRASLVIAAVTAVAVVAALSLSGTAPAAAAECSDSGAVVIVAGTNDPESAHLVGVEQRYTGKMPTVRDGEVVVVDDPGSAYLAEPKDVIHVDYPTTLWPLGAAGYDDSTAQGRSATASAIAGYQKRCGAESDIVVAGYSQGARVAGDVLADIGNGRNVDEVVATDENGEVMLDENGAPVLVTIDPDGISGELYADPRQAGDKTGRGIELSLIGIIPGLTMAGSRGGSETDGGFGELEGRVVSVCIDGDPICDLPDPIHDPIGAIDGLLGYFTKHNLYPFQMYRDPHETTWNDGRSVRCEPESAVCMVAADSAFAELVRDWARDAGYGGAIGDFLSGRPTIELPYGIELANLQPVIRLVQGLLPPLPKLGYGAYLPDLFVFEDILQGILTLSPARFVDGATALAASLRSIVWLPVNFVRYWAGAIVGPVAPRAGTVTVLAADTTSVRSSTFTRLATATDGATEPVRAESPTGSGSPAAPVTAQPGPTDPAPAVDPTADPSGAPADASGSDEEPGEEPAPPSRADEVPATTDPSADNPTVDDPSAEDTSGDNTSEEDTSGGETSGNEPEPSGQGAGAERSDLEVTGSEGGA